MPDVLIRETIRLMEYCHQLTRDAIMYHEEVGKKRAVWFFHYAALSLGKNKLQFYDRRLQECENWLKVAVPTVVV